MLPVWRRSWKCKPLRNLLHEGADVVVDCVTYTADQARMLRPFRDDIGSLVLISSKAVYVDEQGHHSNSVEPPVFPGPVTEEQATMTSSGIDYNSPEGYGANKVAAEHVVIDSGMAVSVLRPSRIHGVGAARPREWVFVKRVLDGRPHVLLARGGRGINHPTAAVNLAALVEFCASRPGTRILNCADPDAPDGLTISRIIAARLGTRGTRSIWMPAPPKGSATTLGTRCRRSCLTPQRRSGSDSCPSGRMRTLSGRRSIGWQRPIGQVTRPAYCRHRTTRSSHISSTTAGRTRGCRVSVNVAATAKSVL